MLTIPDDQLCEAFDPVMVIPGKLANIVPKGYERFLCKAPAYVYLEGAHGKRFLCDFHYIYEKNMISVRKAEDWDLVEQYLIEKLEDVKNTFGEPEGVTQEDLDALANNLCWCGGKPHMIATNIKSPEIVVYFCNFHFRKTFFRYHSHNKNYLDVVSIKDARKILHNQSIKEEAEKLLTI